MKKVSIYMTMIIVAIISFMGGIIYEDWFYNVDQLFEMNKFKAELIKNQYNALDKAAIVIDNNGLLDKDGSDDMQNYLTAINSVDSLYNLQDK